MMQKDAHEEKKAQEPPLLSFLQLIYSWWWKTEDYF